MFDKVDMEGKTNPDGMIGLTVSFLESTWQSADRFRCINVRLMQETTKPIEMDQLQMTDKEKMELIKSQEKDYKRRIERSRPCLLPAPICREVMQMLKTEGKVSFRTLQKITDRVHKRYHDEFINKSIMGRWQHVRIHFCDISVHHLVEYFIVFLKFSSGLDVDKPKDETSRCVK